MQRYICLVIHCHQPIGNFPHVFEHAYKVAYLPFLEALVEHEGVKCALHYSGILYEWFQKNHPEFLQILAKLVQREQVELLCGGFYEPILPAIPDEDKVLQIKEHIDYIKREFGISPHGFWTAERVWEPHLAKYIYEAGARYTFLDDTHFKLLGWDEAELRGHFLTEEEGKTIGIFPISKKMRYLIPFSSSPDEVIAYLRSQREGALLLLGDDGEKFGLWPGTKEWVWDKGWIHSFFEKLEEADDIQVVCPKDWFFKKKALGRVYLPTASYEEMMEWALPPNAALHYQRLLEEAKSSFGAEGFVKGAHWRNFLIKYEEANILHKKMMYLSNRARKAGCKDALKEVLKAQCNCAMWHGIFGGLYLPHLRARLHTHLVKAEEFLYDAEGMEGVRFEVLDVNKDGEDEIIVETPTISACIKREGAAFLWLDDKRKGMNLLNTLTRRAESYHERMKDAKKEGEGVKSIHEVFLLKDEDAAHFLHYDRWERNSFLNYFLFDVPEVAQLYEAQIEPLLGPSLPYSYKILREELLFFCQQRMQDARLWIEKMLSFKEPACIKMKCTITSSSLISCVFCTEFNILPPSLNTHYLMEGESVNVESMGKRECVSSLSMEDEGFLLHLSLAPPMDVVFFPIYTASLSESGVERTFQGASIVFCSRAEFGKGEKEFTISISLDSKKPL